LIYDLLDLHLPNSWDYNTWDCRRVVGITVGGLWSHVLGSWDYSVSHCAQLATGFFESESHYVTQATF
jgi:hypothetical protein